VKKKGRGKIGLVEPSAGFLGLIRSLPEQSYPSKQHWIGWKMPGPGTTTTLRFKGYPKMAMTSYKVEADT
jgi:hypothetical protein